MATKANDKKTPDAAAGTKSVSARDWNKEENALISRLESHGLKAADAREIAKKKIAARKARAEKGAE